MFFFQSETVRSCSIRNTHVYHIVCLIKELIKYVCLRKWYFLTFFNFYNCIYMYLFIITWCAHFWKEKKSWILPVELCCLKRLLKIDKRNHAITNSKISNLSKSLLERSFGNIYTHQLYKMWQYWEGIDTILTSISL